MVTVHEVEAKAPEVRHQDLTGAGSRSVSFHGRSSTGRNHVHPVVQELRDADLKVPEANKSGKFVVLEKQQLEEKVSAALYKNFFPVRKRPSGSLRIEAECLCDALKKRHWLSLSTVSFYILFCKNI